MKRALLVALSAFGIASSADAQERYVPAGIWDDAEQADSYERYYGGPLRVMGEPILSRPGARSRFAMRLRLLVVPDRGSSSAIRIDGTESGGRVSFVQLYGARRDDPGQVAYRRYYHLSAAEMRDVRRLVRQSGLASSPARAEWREPPPRVTADGDQEIVMCLHPPDYVFELTDATGSRFVVRDACALENSPALWALADEILSLHPRRRRAGN